MKGGDNLFSISSMDDSIFYKYPELINQVDRLRNFIEIGFQNHELSVNVYRQVL